MISHISYAQERARYIVKHYSAETICSSVGNNGQFPFKYICQMMDTLKTEELQSFKYLKLLAKFNGMSISEFMLSPDADFDGRYSTASESSLRFNIKDCRVEHGWDTASLGRRTGLGVLLIEDIEENRIKELSLNTLQIIADVLKVEVASLFKPNFEYSVYNRKYANFSNAVFVEDYLDELFDSYSTSELLKGDFEGKNRSYINRLHVKEARPIKNLILAQKIARLSGKSIAELFINPNCPVADKYKKASLAFIGVNLRRIRKEKYVLQNDLALHAGYANPSALCAIERGDNYPAIQYLQRMADYLGVEIADLFLPPPEVKPQRKVVT